MDKPKKVVAEKIKKESKKIKKEEKKTKSDSKKKDETDSPVNMH